MKLCFFLCEEAQYIRLIELWHNHNHNPHPDYQLVLPCQNKTKTMSAMLQSPSLILLKITWGAPLNSREDLIHTYNWFLPPKMTRRWWPNLGSPYLLGSFSTSWTWKTERWYLMQVVPAPLEVSSTTVSSSGSRNPVRLPLEQWSTLRRLAQA